MTMCGVDGVITHSKREGMAPKLARLKLLIRKGNHSLPIVSSVALLIDIAIYPFRCVVYYALVSFFFVCIEEKENKHTKRRIEKSKTLWALEALESEPKRESEDGQSQQDHRRPGKVDKHSPIDVKFIKTTDAWADNPNGNSQRRCTFAGVSVCVQMDADCVCHIPR